MHAPDPLQEFDTGTALTHVVQFLIDAAQDKASAAIKLLELAFATSDVSQVVRPLTGYRVGRNRLKVGCVVFVVSTARRPRSSKQEATRIVLSVSAETRNPASGLIGQIVLFRTACIRRLEREWLVEAIHKLGRWPAPRNRASGPTQRGAARRA
jgi:hypothetical protein